MKKNGRWKKIERGVEKTREVGVVEEERERERDEDQDRQTGERKRREGGEEKRRREEKLSFLILPEPYSVEPRGSYYGGLLL